MRLHDALRALKTHEAVAMKRCYDRGIFLMLEREGRDEMFYLSPDYGLLAAEFSPSDAAADYWQIPDKGLLIQTADWAWTSKRPSKK